MKTNCCNKLPLRSFWAAFLTVILFFACKEDEKPNESASRINVTGIELISGTIPNARVAANVSWLHLYPTELQITFKETQSGKSYNLKIDPNDFSKNYSLEIPVGIYTYEGSTASTNPISSELPITVKGELQAGNPSTDLKLKAYSAYGLLSFSKRNISTPPAISTATPFPFFEKSGFYYLYHKDQSLKVDVPLTGGKKVRLPITNTSFSHSQFQFRTAGDSDPDLFVNKDFNLNQRTFTISTEGYPTELMTYSPAELPQSQRETSGLTWIQGKLFSINDGGNAAELYELNPQTGAVARTITIDGVSNIDWEDLAVSPTHLFIGDFGNNLGSRTDLRIIRVSISDLLSQTRVQSQLLEFSFEDQTQFSFPANSHNFDCEAMIFHNGKIHLFSKNWGDSKTKHYSLPSDPGKHKASLLGSTDTQGLVTGADISANGKHLVLIGYENKGVSSRAFVWGFPNFNGSPLSTVKGFQFFIGSPLNVGQTEGITFMGGLETKISGESLNVLGTSTPPRMFELDWTGIFTP